jgi:hypothetical protein
MFPAAEGDCLWIEYGNDQAPHRVLIDAGTPGTYSRLRKRLEALPAKDRRFELFVITHIDSDHIGGALDLLRDKHRLGVTFDDVWFNGWIHLLEKDERARLRAEAEDILGSRQAEGVTDAILRRKLPWNRAFDGEPVMLDGGRPTSKTLPGGLALTLLTPGAAELRALRPKWEEELRKNGLLDEHGRPIRDSGEVTTDEDDLLGRRPRPKDIELEKLAQFVFTSDTAEANGSSITLIAEFDGRRCLLAADGHAPILTSSLRQVAGGAGSVRVDLFKISHHGSRGNTSRELLEVVDCRRYAISTNGARHEHPDREAIARVIRFGGSEPELLFNYTTRFTTEWNKPEVMEQRPYHVQYPAGNERGFVIDI